MARSDVERVDLRTDLERLESMDDGELHRFWQVRVGRKMPSHLPRSLFVRLLAHRLQAQASGERDRPLLNHLDKALAGESGERNRGRRLRPGSILVREHGGELHRVMVLETGFAWSGKTFSSLSDTAFAITGTKWNGPRFFGLKGKRGTVEAAL